MPGAPGTIARPAVPARGEAPDTVQLLVHGGTYNSAYWDLPYQPERYSYQRDMAAHGYATFAADQLGAGRSSRPLSLPLSVWAAAESTHEVVGHLRAGHVGGVRFAKVVIVGHSVGSGVVAVEASTYHDVDGVVLTGITHLPALPVLAIGAALGLQPALLDGRLGPGSACVLHDEAGCAAWALLRRRGFRPGRDRGRRGDQGPGFGARHGHGRAVRDRVAGDEGNYRTGFPGGGGKGRSFLRPARAA